MFLFTFKSYITLGRRSYSVIVTSMCVSVEMLKFIHKITEKISHYEHHVYGDKPSS